MINLRLKQSVIAALFITVALISSYLLLLTFSELKYELLSFMVIITAIWFKQLLYYPNHQIQIDLKQKHIILHHGKKAHTVKLKAFYSFGFGTIVLFSSTNEYKLFIIPIFIDSLTIGAYKHLKAYLRWH